MANKECSPKILKTYLNSRVNYITKNTHKRVSSLLRGTA